MSTLTIPQQDMSNFDFRYRHSEIVNIPGYTQPILIFNTMNDVNCAIYPVSGTARFEYTISSSSDVVNDVAVWFPWPSGDVSVNVVDSMLSNATCIRGFTTGEAKFEMSGV